MYLLPGKVTPNVFTQFLRLVTRIINRDLVSPFSRKRSPNILVPISLQRILSHHFLLSLQMLQPRANHASVGTPSVSSSIVNAFITVRSVIAKYAVAQTARTTTVITSQKEHGSMPSSRSWRSDPMLFTTRSSVEPGTGANAKRAIVSRNTVNVSHRDDLAERSASAVTVRTLTRKFNMSYPRNARAGNRQRFCGRVVSTSTREVVLQFVNGQCSSCRHKVPGLIYYS